MTAGPPAHQVWLPPLDEPPTLDELLPGRSRSRPTRPDRRRARRARAGCRCRSASSTGRSSSCATCCGWTCSARPATWPWPARPQSGKSHRAAVPDPALALTHTPARGAVLLPGLRRRLAGHAGRTCRTSAGSPAGSTRDRVRRTVAEIAHPARASASEQFRRARHRLDGHLPAPPGRRRARRTSGSATSSWSSTAGPRCARTSRSSSRPSPTSPPAASPTASTWSSPPRAGRSSARPCATCSAPASSCGWATRPTPRSTGDAARPCRSAPGPRADPGRACTSWPRCPGSTADDRGRPGRRRRRAGRARSAAAWRGPRAPQVRMLPAAARPPGCRPTATGSRVPSASPRTTLAPV